MKIALLTLLFLTKTCFAESKNLGASMHGDKLAVTYEEIGFGKFRLTVKEKTVAEDRRVNFKELQVIDLNLKKNESLSSFNGFSCETNEKKFAYGVIKKNKAKEKELFKPERAWAVDEKNLKLVLIQNVSKVFCKWNPDGETRYPF